LQSIALHSVYAALGGMQIYGSDGGPTTVMDSTERVRQTMRHTEPDGQRFVYTINATVNVTKVPLS
jgi:hypothetical protein